MFEFELFAADRARCFCLMNQLADDDYDYILIKILIFLVGNCVK